MKKLILFCILLSAAPSYAQWQANWQNPIFSGSVTAAQIDGIIAVDGIRYTTLESALAACAGAGCNVLVPSGFRETFTANIQIGSPTQSTIVWMMPDSQLTCNNTGGNVVTTGDCFSVHKASGFRCITAGSGNTGAPKNGGCDLALASTANVRTLVSSADVGSGGQSSMVLHGMIFEGNTSATVALAMINIEAVLGLSELSDNYVIRFGNTIGLLVRSNANAGPAVVGPLVLNNWWVDGGANAGARPLVIQCNTNGINPMDILGGVYHHPGSGLANVELNGSNAPIGNCQNVRIKSYIENLANGNSILVKIVDMQGVTIEAMKFLEQDTDTAVDISETASGKTANIHILAMNVASTTNLGTHINNHITGEVIGGTNKQNVPFYNFCNAETVAYCVPFTISGNAVNIKDNANVTRFSYDPTIALSGNPFSVTANTLFKNSLDQALNVTIDSGTTATQNASLFFKDRTTTEWEVRKSSGNVWFLLDAAGVVRQALNQTSGASEYNAAPGANLITFNVRNTTGTSGVAFGNGAAAAVEVARIDGSGTVDFKCTAALTNCGQIGGAFTANRLFTFPDLAGTVCASGSPCSGTTLTSTVATGTAPLTVTSTTTVPNLTVSNHPKIQFCGTTSTCSATAQVTGQIVYGSAPLVSGAPSTVTISGISPAFTSTSSYDCNATDETTAANNLLKVVNVSSSSFTITGPATITDTVSYVCVGN